MKTKIILIVLLITAFKFSYSQPLVDWQLVGNALNGGEILGSNTTLGVYIPLVIQTNDGAQSNPIDFYINANYFLSIIANGNARTGDLDVIQPTNGYEIGDWTAGPPTNNLVLWHNG